MMFTFVYMGWEATANDARVFLDVMSKEVNHFSHLDKDIYEYNYYSLITTYISLTIK